MSRRSLRPFPKSASFPRVSGDEPDRLRYEDFYSEFSPRERG